MDNQADNTRKNIREAFTTLLQEKSFDQINVSEITEAANCERESFYEYFLDKYSLIEEVETLYIYNVLRVLREIYQESDGKRLSEVGDSSSNLFKYIYDHRFEFRDAGENNSGFKSKEALAHALRWMVTSELSLETDGEETTSSVYTTEFLLGGLESIVRKWREAGFEESPEALQTVFANIVKKFDEVTIRTNLMENRALEQDLQEIIESYQEYLPFR